MANVVLKWEILKKIPATTGGWVAFKREINNKILLDEICNPRTVYVVKLCRPFCFHYDKNVSGVAYIGRGNFKERMKVHLKSWIKSLSHYMPDVYIEILVCLPRVQKNLNAYKDVEASQIDKFEQQFGSLPVKNGRREKSHRNHTFSKSDIAKAFGRGKGPGYHWAIWPVGSNPLYR